MYRYTSVLRAGIGNGDKDLLAFLKKYPKAYDEVLFFVGSSHAVRSPAFHLKEAEHARGALARVENSGVHAGLDVHPTVGFFPPLLDENAKPYAKTVNPDGSENEGKLCAGNEENHRIIREIYRNYAKNSQGAIYVDDDVLVGNCFCPSCVRRFASLYGFFEDKEPTRENLLALFESDDLALRKRVRESWLDFIALRSADVLRAVEAGVSDVDPTRELGLMSCTCGFDGLDCASWAKALRGSTERTLRWRPGGGCYTEFTPDKVLNKANRIGAQIRYVPDFVQKIEAEVENFPGQMLMKSPDFTSFETLMYLAAGCTGATFSSICLDSDRIEEHEAFFRKAEAVRVSGETLVHAFQREKPEGVGFWWNRYSAADLAKKTWNFAENVNVRFPEAIYTAGLPIAYDNEKTLVYLLNHENAVQMTDDEIRDVLHKGVFMDDEALEVLNARGFARQTGFRVGKKLEGGISERDTDCFVNMPGAHVRYLYLGFANEEIVNKSTVYTLEKTDPLAVETSVLMSENGLAAGLAGGLFENEWGGRVAVRSADPFAWYASLPRCTQLKNTFSWLSHGKIAYIRSLHRAALWVRGKAAYLANMAMADLHEVELFLPGESDAASVTVFKAGEVLEKMQIRAIEKTEGGFVFRLPVVPVTGSALICRE